MLKLLEEDDEDIIDSALEAYGQLCINFSKLSDSSGQTSKVILKFTYLLIIFTFYLILLIFMKLCVYFLYINLQNFVFM